MKPARSSEIRPIVTISGPGANAAGLRGEQHLETQQRIERDIEEQSREHRRDRRRAFGMGVGQPRMQRRKPHFRAIAEQQEHKGPTPISAVLSGLLLNVALYALLRFKMLLALNPAAITPGPLMVDAGADLEALFAAFMLYRRRDIKRRFAYSSIEHMGIIVFAFGMGGPLANFAGLLHMTMHSLTKWATSLQSAIWRGQGHAEDRPIGGLTVTHPVLRLGPACSAWWRSPGLPPLGMFMREFLVVISTFAREPWLARVASTGDPDCARRPIPAHQHRCLRRAARAGRARRKHPTCRCSRTWRSCSRPASLCRPRWSPEFENVARLLG